MSRVPATTQPVPMLRLRKVTLTQITELEFEPQLLAGKGARGE